MAGKGLSEKFVLRLESAQFKAGINKVKAHLQSFGNYIKGAFAIGSITAFGRSVVQIGSDFEAAMARVKAITNAGGDSFKMLRDEALEMGRTTKYTSIEAANALEVLTRNGMNAAEAVRALPTVMKTAQANAIGLADAANILTNTMNMFGLSVGSAEDVANILSTTAAHTATNIDELYSALTNAAPAAAALGFKLEDTSAALGALAQKGIKAEEAGTQLRMAFMKMVDPNIIKNMDKYNLGINEATIKTDGLQGTVKKLKDANLGFSELVDIFSQKGAIGIQRLISAYDELELAMEYTYDAEGEVQRMFVQGLGTTEKELAILKSKWQDLLISFQSSTHGPFNTVVRVLQSIVDNFKSWFGWLMNALPLISIAIGKVVNNAVAGCQRVQGAALKLGAAFKASLGLITTIVGEIVSIWFIKLYDTWNKIVGEIQRVKKEFGELADTTRGYDTVAAKTGKIANEVNRLVDSIANATEKEKALKIVTNQITDMMPDMADYVRDAYKEVGDTKNITAGSEALEEYRRKILSVVNLQGKMNQLRAATKNKDTYQNSLAYTLERQKGKTSWDKSFWSVIEEQRGGDIKDVKGYIAADIADELVKSNDVDEAAQNIVTQLQAWSVNMPKDIARAYASIAFNGDGDNGKIYDRVDYLKNAKQANDYIANLTSEIENSEKILKRKNLEIEAGELKIKFDENTSDEDLQTATNKAKLHGNGGSSGETPELRKALDDYYKELTKLNNQHKEQSITEDVHGESIKKLTEETWKTITAISNFRDELNKKDIYSDTDRETVNQIIESGKEYATDDLINDLIGDIDDDFRKGIDELQETLEQENEVLKDKLLNLMESLDEINNTIFDIKKKRDTSDDVLKYAEGFVTDLSKAEKKEKKEKEKSSKKKKEKKEVSSSIIEADIDYNESKIEKLKTLIAYIQEGLLNGDYQGMEKVMNSLLNSLIAKLEEAKGGAKSLGNLLSLSEAQESLKEAKETLWDTLGDGLTSLAQGMDRFIDALQDVGESLGLDEDAFEGWEKFMNILNAEIQMMEVFKTVIETVKAVEAAISAVKKKDAVQQVIANKAVVASEEEKVVAETAAAAAGAASSTAAIPIVGPALAIGAVAAVIAAIVAATKGFAEGGLVGGNSTSGDKLLARVNSGEGILTAEGVKNLGTLYNNQGQGGGVSGDVKFHIHGSELEGVLKNYNMKKRG